MITFANKSADMTGIKVLGTPLRILPTTVESLNAQIEAKTLQILAHSKNPVPVLYTSNIVGVFGGSTGTGWLGLDESNQIDELEYIALPYTVFRVQKIIAQHNRLIAQVLMNEYPYPTEKWYFIDLAFTQEVRAPYSETIPTKWLRTLRSNEQILESLVSRAGPVDSTGSVMEVAGGPKTKYVWWGNIPEGIPAMLKHYPSVQVLDPVLTQKWQLRGVDCSGLLYWATNGATPRNTSALVNFGTGVTIADRSLDQMVAELKPLDLIVWRGHTLIVLPGGRVIESTWKPENNGGVYISSLRSRLLEIMDKRSPLNNILDILPEWKKGFVVRRWASVTK